MVELCNSVGKYCQTRAVAQPKPSTIDILLARPQQPLDKKGPSRAHEKSCRQGLRNFWGLGETKIKLKKYRF